MLRLTGRYRNLSSMRTCNSARQNLLTTALQLAWEQRYGVVSDAASEGGLEPQDFNAKASEFQHG